MKIDKQKLLYIVVLVVPFFIASGILANFDLSEIIPTQEETKEFNLLSHTVDIPKSWIKIEDTGQYVAWLTREGYEENRQHSHGVMGAKYAAGYLNNPDNLSVEEWLKRYSGDNLAPLLSSEDVTIKGISSRKYIFDNPRGSTRGRHTNVYIPIFGKIIVLAVYYFDDNSTEQLNFESLVESFK